MKSYLQRLLNIVNTNNVVLNKNLFITSFFVLATIGVLLLNITLRTNKLHNLFTQASTLLTSNDGIMTASVSKNTELAVGETVSVQLSVSSSRHDIYSTDVLLNFNHNVVKVKDIQFGPDIRNGCVSSTSSQIPVLFVPSVSDLNCSFRKTEIMNQANTQGMLHFGILASDWTKVNDSSYIPSPLVKGTQYKVANIIFESVAYGDAQIVFKYDGAQQTKDTNIVAIVNSSAQDILFAQPPSINLAVKPISTSTNTPVPAKITITTIPTSGLTHTVAPTNVVSTTTVPNQPTSTVRPTATPTKIPIATTRPTSTPTTRPTNTATPQPATSVVSQCGVNLVENGTFEQRMSPWKLATNGTVDIYTSLGTSIENDRSVKIRVRSGGAGTDTQMYKNDITLLPNTQYVLSFRGYSESGHNVIVRVIDETRPAENIYYLARNLTNTYSPDFPETKVTFTTPNRSITKGRVLFQFATDAKPGDFYAFDDIELRVSSTQCTATSVPTNTPIPTRTPTRVPTPSFTPTPTSALSRYCGVNLVTNGTFETQMSPWRFYTNGQAIGYISEPGYESLKALKMRVRSGGAGTDTKFYVENITLLPQTQYTLSMVHWSESGHNAKFQLYSKNTGQNYGLNLARNITNATSPWGTTNYTFTTTNTNTVTDAVLAIQFADDATANDFYIFDNINLKVSESACRGVNVVAGSADTREESLLDRFINSIRNLL